MIHAQLGKDKILINNVARTAGNTATGWISVTGADYLTLRCAISDAATAGFASSDGLKIVVTEAVDSNVSNTSVITTISNVTGIKNACEKVYHIDTRTRKQVIHVAMTAGTSGVSNEATTVSCIGTLTRLEASPTSTGGMVSTSTNDAVVIA